MLQILNLTRAWKPGICAGSLFRISMLATGLWISGCACKRIQIAIHPNADLKGLNAIPVEIYFAPPGEETDRCKAIKNGDKDWFDPAIIKDAKPQYIVRATAVDNGRPINLYFDIVDGIGSIFIWGDYPQGVDRANRCLSKDPATLEKCNLTIRVARGGLTAN